MDLNEFKKEIKNNTAKRKHISYEEGSDGYKLIAELRGMGISVEKLTVHLLKEAMNKNKKV